MQAFFCSATRYDRHKNATLSLGLALGHARLAKQLSAAADEGAMTDTSIAFPECVVTIDGNAFDGELLQVVVNQELDCPAQCRIAIVGEHQLLPGASIELHLNGQLLFRGRISAVRRKIGRGQPPGVEIRAYDTLDQLSALAPQRLFTNRSLQALASELLTGSGVQVQGGAQASFTRLAQHRHSDLDLLRQACRLCGQHFHLFDNMLAIFDIGNGNGENPVELDIESLFSCEIEHDQRSDCGQIHTSGWDSVSGSLLQAQAGQGATHAISDLPADHPSRMQALAQGILAQQQAATRHLCGLANGNPSLRPGRPVRLSSGEQAVLAQVTHQLNSGQGFTTRFDSLPTPRAAFDRASIASFARVCAVNDPDGRGRVQVEYPSMGNLVVDWLPVIIPGAGPGKGLTALPQVDDTVVVLLPAGDPTQGLVLGGVYQAGESPNTGASSGEVQAYSLQSPGGQQIRLEDDQKRLLLTQADGSTIYLEPQGITIKAIGDLNISAPGKNITITAAKVDFKQG